MCMRWWTAPRLIDVEGSRFGGWVGDRVLSSGWDIVFAVCDHFDTEEWGYFVAVVWETWTARNRCLFGSPDHDVANLSERAISFEGSYPDACNNTSVPGAVLPYMWTSPPSRIFKVNFDGAELGD